ncbi:MAG: hypothetical protein AAGI69_11265 [Cyanobacteria bacterium P01_H01_bin.21]
MMQTTQYLRKPQELPPGFITSTGLLIASFAIAFFPRIVQAVGAPAPVNFLHFILLPLACAIVMCTSRVRDQKQIAIVNSILLGLAILFAIATGSALLNGAGLVNVFLGLMIISEPFIFLAALLSIPFTPEILRRFKKWILGFGAAHFGLALLQKIGLSTGILPHTRLTIEDNVQGVFYLSSGGHVVGSSVSLLFGLYFYFTEKSMPTWVRTSVLLAVMAQILVADAKQVIFVGIIAWVLLILSKLTDIKVALQYIIAAVLIGYVFYWCIYNVDAFRAYQTWIRPHIYGPEGDATLLKTGPLRIIPNHYTSALNWLFGLGPGHTIGRIGGWMIRDYWSLVGPLGATIHPVSELVWKTWDGHYLNSSFFSPFWGWAGIWGDLGFLGLASYIFLWIIAWQHLCKDDLSRFFVLNVLINGFIFTLMEEPGFTLTTIILICLRWHEQRLKEQQSRFQG